MDERILKSLEAWMGFPVGRSGGVEVRASDRRTDGPFNRFVVNLLVEGGSVSVSCLPRLVPTFQALMSENSSAELFSDFGMDQIRRRLGANDDGMGTGFSYALWDPTGLRPVEHSFEIVQRVAEDGRIRFECRIGNEVAGWAEVYDRDPSGTSFIDVETAEEHRRRGIATALAFEATVAILRQGKVARYGAEKTNFSSLRIAQRLGYRQCSQHIVG